MNPTLSSSQGYKPIESQASAYQASDIASVREWSHPLTEIKHTSDLGYHGVCVRRNGQPVTSLVRACMRSSADRSAFRSAIDQMAAEIRGVPLDETPSRLEQERALQGERFQARFALRRLLGQPVTVAALNNFFESEESASAGARGVLSGAWKDVSRGFHHVNPVGRRYSNFSETLPSDELEENQMSGVVQETSSPILPPSKTVERGLNDLLTPKEQATTRATERTPLINK